MKNTSSSKPGVVYVTTTAAETWQRATERARAKRLEADSNLMLDDETSLSKMVSTASREDMDAEDDDMAMLAPQKSKKRKVSTSSVAAAKPNVSSIGARVKKRGLMQILADDNVTDAFVVNYFTAAAKPSVAPPRVKPCTVCGLLAPQRCVECGSRFCSLQCFTVHKETRCLKFA
jgi:zinc finger HIT domain-containing protein 1